MQDRQGDNEPKKSTPEQPTRDVGLMPAIMALLMIGGIVMIIACGIGSWFVFNKSPTLASGTLKAIYIPLVEQSNLEPDEKKLVVGSLRQLSEDLEAGKLEPHQANQLMQNLIRAPIVQWGDLDAISQLVAQRETFSEQEKMTSALAIARLKYGIGNDSITANDVEDAIDPVTEKDDTQRGCHLRFAADDESLRETFHRVNLLLEREQIPQHVDEVRLSDVLRFQVEKATSE